MDSSNVADRPPEAESFKNPVPHPSIDVTQTEQWVSVKNPALLDLSSVVIHNNMEVLAGLIQAQSRILLELAMDQKESKEDIRTIKADLRTLKAVLRAQGEDVTSETSQHSSISSRRSSLGSLCPSIIEGLDGVTIEGEEQDPGVAALEKFIDNIEILDIYFENFILSSSKTPLVKHTKDLQASSEAFKVAARTQLTGYLGEESANEIIEQLSIFDQGQLEEAYMAMSRRYGANKGKGPIADGWPPKAPRKAWPSPSLFVKSGGDDEEQA